MPTKTETVTVKINCCDCTHATNARKLCRQKMGIEPNDFIKISTDAAAIVRKVRKANKDCGFSKANSEDLFLTAADIRMLGLQVGGTAQIEKCNETEEMP